jgi:signal transduction histidine kinase
MVVTRKWQRMKPNLPNNGKKRKILLLGAGLDLAAHLSSLNSADWDLVKREAWVSGDEVPLTLVDGLSKEKWDESSLPPGLVVYLSDSPSKGIEGGMQLLILSRSQFLKSDVNLVMSLLTEFSDIINYIKHLEIESRPFFRQAQLGAALQGLVHNVNNQLTSIMGLLELMHQENRPTKDMVLRYEQFLRLQADFANLLRVSRRDITQESSSFDLNALIREELRLMTNSDAVLRNKVICKTDLDTNLPAFDGVYSDFSHSFVNLVRNALNAMEDVPNPRLTIRTGQDAKHIWLEVKDQGIGIPERLVDDIFKPYVSHRAKQSKSESTGLGLGLYTSKELLNKYGVEWKVESREGEGARFTLEFPREKVCKSPET